MKKLNTNGFSVIEVLLVIFVVAVVGGVGYYVYQKRSNATNKSVATDSSTTTESKPAIDPTADWKSYTSESGDFTVKYPNTWVTATNPELCSDGIFLLGADSASVGKCASSGFGQMTITWRTDREVCGDLNSEAWQQDSKEAAVVSGVQATKIVGTAKATDVVNGAVPEGTKTTQYCVVANGKTYIANYTQRANYPDVLDDFNVMVTKTLTFN